MQAAAPREMRFLSHCSKAIKLDPVAVLPRWSRGKARPLPRQKRKVADAMRSSLDGIVAREQHSSRRERRIPSLHLFFIAREVLLAAIGMQVHRKVVIYPMPRVSQDMLPSEVMKLARIHHESKQGTLVLL